MNFISMLLRVVSLPIAVAGSFTCVVLIGFPLLMLARDMNEWADRLEARL